MPTKKRYQYNRERLLLTALVAVAFFGFLLWSIEQAVFDQENLLADSITVSFPAGNKSVKISSPKVGAAVKSPVTVSGQTSISEAALQARIKDASGLILAQTKIITAKGQTVSPFSASIKYKKPTRSKGTIEIYSVSPKNGSEMNRLTIPVVFKD